VADVAYVILRSLSTSSIAAIVERLDPLLHIDPVSYLPPEITFEIFSYLDLPTLLQATRLSKSWRVRASDSRLWRNLFGSEGWNSNMRQVREFEEAERQRLAGEQKERKSRTRPAEAVSDVETKSPKKRALESSARTLFAPDDFDTPMIAADSSSQWEEQHGPIEADGDEKMEDVLPEPVITDESPRHRSQPLVSPFKSSSRPSSSPSQSLDPPLKPSLMSPSYGQAPRMNWQYLYKQKIRLEENWQAGRFKNFQLPHPSHPYEAHAECVYTIQYSLRHLVSGSRDKSIRIWNLDTQRLAVPPLRGHDASVLCLQFDDRPDQDIVISGGSDCQVILWKFSTGQMIRRLDRAHQESVLNLRFDDRYLITCSKDKTIKVWNRRAMLPTDEAYPTVGYCASAKFPQYIINIDNLAQSQHLEFKPLREYSLLVTLHGHSAAVNAIQIRDNQIVSASGDRQIKVWEVKTGTCLKTLIGHSKGIACVQFDGRRIVSGSSDETVRIFDRASGVEVACLRGHANLVRTVQARFGDVPGSRLEEEAEARAMDRRFLNARFSGTLPREPTREQRRSRNTGSRDPNDIFAYGAKLPPGGGGSRWARIVSGSYDETVIIWKRDSKGKWTPAHQLYQWEAVLKAGGQPRYVPPPAPQNLPRPPNHGNQGEIANQIAQNGNQHGGNNAAVHPSIASILHPQAAQAQSIALSAQGLTAAPSPTAVTAGPSTATTLAPSSNPNTIVQSHHAGAHIVAGNTTAAVQTSTPMQQHQQSLPSLNQPLPHHPPTQPQLPAAHTQQHGHTAVHATPANGTNSRVFKLQFDSRRIICCSQDPTIVGWDFANGDREIEIASEFFGEDV
jgi:F-box and WD-40 domain protein 1/11